MPEDKPFDEVLAGSGKQEVSTTMAFTRLLRNLHRDPNVGPRVVPIIPDEARTFGMDALFKEFKIYAAQGQRLRAGRRPAAAVLQRGARTARCSRRASPRPARWRRSSPPPRPTRHRGVPDAAVLHLLLDVRLPAGRRPDLVGGRLAGPGLPARRHRRAHDAARRGPAAPGRAQPRAGVHGADRRGVGPGVRLRDGHDRHATASTRCWSTSATSSTTSPSTTRTT